MPNSMGTGVLASEMIYSWGLVTVVQNCRFQFSCGSCYLAFDRWCDVYSFVLNRNYSPVTLGMNAIRAQHTSLISEIPQIKTLFKTVLKFDLPQNINQPVC